MSVLKYLDLSISLKSVKNYNIFSKSQQKSTRRGKSTWKLVKIYLLHPSMLLLPWGWHTVVRHHHGVNNISKCLIKRHIKFYKLKNPSLLGLSLQKSTHSSFNFNFQMQSQEHSRVSVGSVYELPKLHLTKKISW